MPKINKSVWHTFPSESGEPFKIPDNLQMNAAESGDVADLGSDASESSQRTRSGRNKRLTPRMQEYNKSKKNKTDFEDADFVDMEDCIVGMKAFMDSKDCPDVKFLCLC